MSQPLFYDDLPALLRVLVKAPLLYLGVVAFIRLSGKRTTSQMNNFDWIVTVALGSLLGSTLLLKDVALAEGLLAIGSLMLLQWAMTKLTVGVPLVERLVKAEPALLYDRGRFLDQALRRERVTEAEVRSAVREAGFSSLDDVQWVVLESDAGFSVLGKSAEGRTTNAMKDVREP